MASKVPEKPQALLKYQFKFNMDSAPKPFLSICIPTRNGAEWLSKAIEQITSDPYFRESKLVELVVSDNCSTDNTEQVIESYKSRFPDLIQYSRTPFDIEDKNFERVLRMGRGEHLKLLNDSFAVRPGFLKPFVGVLQKLAQSRPVVFIVNEPTGENENPIRKGEGIDEFIKIVSYKCTWIGGFGIWKSDLDTMLDFSRCSALRLVQVDVLLRLLSQRKEFIVLKAFVLNCLAYRRKGGYCLAEVFARNYLSLLKPCVDSNDLSRAVFASEKKNVLLEHILPLVVDPSHDYSFETLEQNLEDYSGEEYFKPALEAARAAWKVKVESWEQTEPVSHAMATRDLAAEFQKQWRQVNLHNETTAGTMFDLNKVSVGRRTFGTINVWSWGHSDEQLTIGHFCSIGAGVEFVLGGNHAMDGFSTFPFKVKFFGHSSEALSRGPIVVGDDVWIGNKAMIHSGVSIGQGAVIGAGAIVTRDVPAYSVVVGNPGRVVRRRFDDAVIEELLRLDFGILTDDAIIAAESILYRPLDLEAARHVVQLLMSLSKAGADHNTAKAESEDEA